MDHEIGLDDAYSVSGPAQNRDLYARWASTYEESFIAAEGYLYHRRVADVFAGRDGVGPVLDVGCGTGLVGLELRRLGIGPIDGADISPDMLGEAGKKTLDGEDVYRRLIEADLTGRVEIETDSYAGLVSAGTFTHGHLGPESLDELVRIARPGALCALGINSAHFAELGFDDYFNRLETHARIGGFEGLTIPIYEDTDSEDPDRNALVVVFEVS